MWYIQTLQCYTAIKRNELHFWFPNTTMWASNIWLVEKYKSLTPRLGQHQELSVSFHNIKLRTALASQQTPRLSPDKNKFGRPNSYSYFQKVKTMWILRQLKKEKRMSRLIDSKERVTLKQFAQVKGILGSSWRGPKLA